MKTIIPTPEWRKRTTNRAGKNSSSGIMAAPPCRLLLWVLAGMCLCLPQVGFTAPLEWHATRDEALEEAQKTGKRILLLAGRDTCGNCRHMKNSVLETESIRQLLDLHFVCWFADVDTTQEWGEYATGLGSFTLPLIAFIDPNDSDNFLNRSTSVVQPLPFESILLVYSPPTVDHARLGYIAPAEANAWRHPHWGRLRFASDDPDQTAVWIEGLCGWLQLQGDGAFSSMEYGAMTPGGDSQWTNSAVFGWTHFGADANQYDGWVHTERFGWMKFVYPGGDTTQTPFLYVPMMNSWMAVNPDGSFYSFQWRTLTPQGLNRYQSSVFGGLTTGDFNGWVHSDRFGWMWANGDGTWFWSETRKEWLGVTAEGGIWSTAEGRFL